MGYPVYLINGKRYVVPVTLPDRQGPTVSVSVRFILVFLTFFIT